MSTPAFVINANKASGGGGGGSLNAPITSFFPLDAKNSASWSDDTLTSCMCVPADFTSEAQAPMTASYERMLAGLVPLDPTVANNASKKYTIPNFTSEIKTVAGITIAPARLPNPFGNGFTGVDRLDSTRWVIFGKGAIAVYDESTDTMGDVIPLTSDASSDNSTIQVIADDYIVFTYVNVAVSYVKSTLYSVTGTTAVVEKNSLVLAGSAQFYGVRPYSCKWQTDEILVVYEKRASSNYNVQGVRITYAADAITNAEQLDLSGTTTQSQERIPKGATYMADQQCAVIWDGTSNNMYIVDVYDDTGIAKGTAVAWYSQVQEGTFFAISSTEVVLYRQYSTTMELLYANLSSHVWTPEGRIWTGSTSIYSQLCVGQLGNNKFLIGGVDSDAYIGEVVGGAFAISGRAKLALDPQTSYYTKIGNAAGGSDKGCYIASAGIVDIAINGASVKTGEAFDV